MEGVMEATVVATAATATFMEGAATPSARTTRITPTTRQATLPTPAAIAHTLAPTPSTTDFHLHTYTNTANQTADSVTF